MSVRSTIDRLFGGSGMPKNGKFNPNKYASTPPADPFRDEAAAELAPASIPVPPPTPVPSHEEAPQPAPAPVPAPTAFADASSAPSSEADPFASEAEQPKSEQPNLNQFFKSYGLRYMRKDLSVGRPNVFASYSEMADSYVQDLPGISQEGLLRRIGRALTDETLVLSAFELDINGNVKNELSEDHPITRALQADYMQQIGTAPEQTPPPEETPAPSPVAAPASELAPASIPVPPPTPVPSHEEAPQPAPAPAPVAPATTPEPAPVNLPAGFTLIS